MTDPQPMLTTRQVLLYLGLSRPTLRAMMRATPADVGRPWVNTGTVSGPSYRWQSGPALLEWVDRTSKWREDDKEQE